MITIFGDILCEYCSLETRFLVQIEGEEAFLLLGDKLNVKGGTVHLNEKVVCDYCQKEIELSIVVIENTISAFLNKQQLKKYESGKMKVEKATRGFGINKEKEKKLIQFHATFTTDFEKQPFHLNRVLKLNNEDWKIEKIYRKEVIEKDLVKRLMIQLGDEYWYLLKNDRKEEKWLTITNFKKDNAFLMQESPVAKENEKIHDITDNPFKVKKIFEKTTNENFILSGYEYLSGIRMILRSNHEETGSTIELDIFGDDLDDALKRLEETMAQGE